MTWEEGKPSRNENEYFARRDAEWLREQRAALDAARSARPSGLCCPRDGAELAERVFDGVRIDMCERCRGIWLDAGELEQLLHLAPRTLSDVLRMMGAGGG